MTINNRIVINRLPAPENQLFYKFEYPENVNKFFQSDTLRIKYEFSVTNLPQGILMVPAVAQIAPVAWVRGSDIEVTCLEESFYNSYKTIQHNIMSLLPALYCQSDIYYEHLDKFSMSGSRTGLMFTTGLDSYSALIRRQAQVTDLLYVRGADVPLKYDEVLETVIKNSRNTAKNYNKKHHVVEIDTWGFFNWDSLNNEYQGLLNKDWWELIQHGISLLGAVIPICSNEGITNVLISSTFSSDMPELNGSHPLIDENIHWGENTQVSHVDFDLSRQEKIRKVIKPWAINGGEYPWLRVCYQHWELFNCCKCEKCCQTICGLLVEGIDPRDCGFPDYNSTTLHYIQDKLTTGKFMRNKAELYFWKDIQLHIAQNSVRVDKETAKFLRWFHNFRLKTPNNTSRLSKLIKRRLFFIVKRIKNCSRSFFA